MTAFTTEPDGRVSIRFYSRHARYSRFDRTLYSKQEMEWVDRHADRLSRTDSQIFGALKHYTAEQIDAATLASQIGL